ncbi:MAG: hypothetical protein K0S76_2899 [Herbinix sp.]|jgi:hypothetical protein|nr:hypothetical protein [Herbinix sp.]
MELTTGEFLFYGGIAGGIALFLFSILLMIFYRFRKKKLLKKIQDEY